MKEFDKQLTIKEQFFKEFEQLWKKYDCSCFFDTRDGICTGITDVVIFNSRDFGKEKFPVKEILRYMWPNDKRYR